MNLFKKQKEENLYALEKKIDIFIKWYKENYKFEEENLLTEKQMRNLIDKMAVWYELRYPDKVVKSKFSKYVELDAEDMEKSSRREDTLSFDFFYDTLTDEEKQLFITNILSDIFYFSKYDHVHLDKKNIVIASEVYKIDSDLIVNFVGWNIFDVIEYLKSINYRFDDTIDMQEYKNKTVLKANFLDTVLFRIIERSDDKIGSKRGFIFSSEFDRSMDIPMAYGANLSDENLKSLIDLYMKNGGHSDLVCVNTFISEKYNKSFYTVEDLIILIIAKNNENVQRKRVDLEDTDY